MFLLTRLRTRLRYLTQAVAPFLVRFFKRMVTSYFLKMAATFCFNRVYP
jgi:hypothetical protein